MPYKNIEGIVFQTLTGLKYGFVLTCSKYRQTIKQDPKIVPRRALTSR